MSQNKITKFNEKYPYFLLVLIVLLSIPFAIYSYQLGNSGFTIGLADTETPHIPLNQSDNDFSNFGLSLHLLLGALLTLLVPLQVILGWSRKAMKWHKWMGYLIVSAALLTGLGGLTYIIFNGTIGGTVMNIAFALYGILVILSAIKAAQYARSKQIKLHEEWSMRLFVLGVGSWVYRMGYGMLMNSYSGPMATDGNFQNGIDYFMDFAFFMLPLLGLEIYFRYGKRKAHPLVISYTLLAISAFFIYGFYGFFM